AIINTLLVEPSNKMVVYAGLLCENGLSGVYRTTNGGDTWEAYNEGLSLVPGGWPDVVVSLHFGVAGTLLAATDNGLFRRTGGAVIKSIDGGLTWTDSRGIQGASVWSLAVDPASPLTVYAATDGAGLMKSADGGGTWVRMPIDAAVFRAVVVAPTQPSTVYAM